MIPIVNLRPGLQGPVPRMVVRGAAVLVIGQSESEARVLTLSYAQAVSDRIRANYNALLETLGKDSADLAVQQSAESLSTAQARDRDALGRSQI